MTRVRMIGKWLKVLLGKSYWHSCVGPDPKFIPWELLGYYRDYTPKVCWPGDSDDDGLPLVRDETGRVHCHPVVLAQKALGHWTEWLLSGRGRSDHYRAFIRIADWFVSTQEPDGGWPIAIWRGSSEHLVPYSAMAQGQAVSVLCRAGLSGEDRYLVSARQGIEFMFRPLDQNGVARYTGGGIVLEEAVHSPPTSILNGWVSALFGAHDYVVATDDAVFRKRLASTARTLAESVDLYDAGYWSYYDTRGRIASPYYHRVHVTQMRAMELAFGEYADVFARIRGRFDAQLASRLCKTRALMLKTVQKLREPDSPKASAVNASSQTKGQS